MCAFDLNHRGLDTTTTATTRNVEWFKPSNSAPHCVVAMVMRGANANELAAGINRGVQTQHHDDSILPATVGLYTDGSVAYGAQALRSMAPGCTYTVLVEMEIPLPAAPATVPPTRAEKPRLTVDPMASAGETTSRAMALVRACVTPWRPRINDAAATRLVREHETAVNLVVGLNPRAAGTASVLIDAPALLAMAAGEKPLDVITFYNAVLRNRPVPYGKRLVAAAQDALGHAPPENRRRKDECRRLRKIIAVLLHRYLRGDYRHGRLTQADLETGALPWPWLAQPSGASPGSAIAACLDAPPTDGEGDD